MESAAALQPLLLCIQLLPLLPLQSAGCASAHPPKVPRRSPLQELDVAD